MNISISEIEKPILKLVVTIVITTILINATHIHASSVIEMVQTVLMIAIAIYTLITIFSCMLHLSGNYIIAIILSLVVLFLLAKAGDYATKKKLLTIQGTYIVGVIIGALMVVTDIWKIIRYFKAIRLSKRLSQFNSSDNNDDKET